MWEKFLLLIAVIYWINSLRAWKACTTVYEKGLFSSLQWHVKWFQYVTEKHALKSCLVYEKLYAAHYWTYWLFLMHAWAAWAWAFSSSKSYHAVQFSLNPSGTWRVPDFRKAFLFSRKAVYWFYIFDFMLICTIRAKTNIWKATGSIGKRCSVFTLRQN